MFTPPLLYFFIMAMLCDKLAINAFYSASFFLLPSFAAFFNGHL